MTNVRPYDLKAMTYGELERLRFARPDLRKLIDAEKERRHEAEKLRP